MIGGQTRRRWLAMLLALVTTALLLSACGEAQQPAGETGSAGEVGTVVETGNGRYRDVTPAELKNTTGRIRAAGSRCRCARAGRGTGRR